MKTLLLVSFFVLTICFKWTFGKVIKNEISSYLLDMVKGSVSSNDLKINDFRFLLANQNQDNLKCLKDLKRYGSCIYDMKTANQDIIKMCNTFETDDCKEFINDVFMSNTTCESDENSALDHFIKQMRAIYISGCSKNEKNGGLCPLTYAIHNKGREFDTKKVNVTEKSCISENCKQQLSHIVDLTSSAQAFLKETDENEKSESQQILEDLIKTAVNYVDTKSIKKYLDSDVCSDMTVSSAEPVFLTETNSSHQEMDKEKDVASVSRGENDIVNNESFIASANTNSNNSGKVILLITLTVMLLI
ncbi:hypothetical protein PIROE2DRAFT_6708 [Piromyces sp. E2]|nr:hypothetical protein PIROE2DRAFT_6708 [Piromyces sp. E2]|eukprot:OUM66177.1 hypothetical protein PIROE2DRAFT_6708 [Piromyces sp. E2]